MFTCYTLPYISRFVKCFCGWLPGLCLTLTGVVASLVGARHNAHNM